MATVAEIRALCAGGAKTAGDRGSGGAAICGPEGVRELEGALGGCVHVGTRRIEQGRGERTSSAESRAGSAES